METTTTKHRREDSCETVCAAILDARIPYQQPDNPLEDAIMLDVTDASVEILMNWRYWTTIQRFGEWYYVPRLRSVMRKLSR